MKIQDFIDGVKIIEKYSGNCGAMPAIGNRNKFIFGYLKSMEDEDLKKLNELGWIAKNVKNDFSFAECELYYADD